MSRIAETFAALKRLGRGGFIPFITAGDPDIATTELLLIELAAAGADIIELGVPFSDPVADGETIQRASERALRKGVTLRDVLTCVARAKQHIDVPIVLFSYFNPLLRFGEDRLANKAKEAGVDAVLVTDLIPEEAQTWIEILVQRDLEPIFLDPSLGFFRNKVRHKNRVHAGFFRFVRQPVFAKSQERIEVTEEDDRNIDMLFCTCNAG